MIYMETKLIVHPDKENQYREAEKGMYPIIEKFGVKVIGSWHTSIGDSNEYTIIFGYEDMGQLQKSSMAMMQDKEYQAVWQKIPPLIISQNRKIMMPMPTSPLK